MESSVKQRLILYLKNKKIGQTRFEKLAGLSTGYISNLKNSPSVDKAEKILMAAPDLNRVWLLTGEGDMIIGQRNETTGIPFMGEAEMVAAGDLAGFGQPITPAQVTDNIILPALHFKPGDFAVSVRGRSMVDTEHPELSINDGAIVCLRPWNESFIRWGEIYCLFTTSGYAVKKLQPSDKDDCLMCVSSNEGEGYMPYKVSKAEIRGIAKVTAVINLQLF